METAAAPKPAPKKAADIQVLHCLGPGCGALLGYEVNSENVLHVDLSHMAVADGEVRFFPCPNCGGRNLIEPFADDRGRRKHRVMRFVGR